MHHGLRLAAITLLLAALPAAALQLQPDPAGLNSAELNTSRQLLDEVQQLLPPLLQEQLPHTLHIGWSRLPAHIMGRATASGRILLNHHWLQTLVANPQATNLPGRQHPSLRHELQATLIHELAHLYDRGRFWPPARRSLQARCRTLQKTIGHAGLPQQCHGQTNRRFTLSDDPHLLDLAGWPQETGQKGRRTANNHQQLRSPDAYERARPAEFVAVNLEYFLLDPTYACRRPAMAAYLQQHFSWSPPHTVSCPSGLPHLNAGLDAETPLARLHPERIYQVHYLLAEPDNSWAGRWGHSMLRLVVCAPQRQPGPDCLLDLEHHLVLSYRAFVEDLQLSNWKGLSGVYPSRLFILPLQQVVEEYTRTELRSLASIPLALKPAQIQRLAQQAVTQHWSYDGRYYFISNNCAVETLKLLRSASPGPALHSLDSQTPAGLLQALKNRNLADTSALDNRNDAMRKGLFFDSHRERYHQLFAAVREALHVPQQRFESWLQQSALHRRPLLARSPDMRTTAALLVLEQAALRQQLQHIRNDLKLRYLGNHNDKALAETGQLMAGLLHDSSFLSRPADLLPQGYGLPQSADWHDPQHAVQQRYDRLRQMAGELEQRLPQLLTRAQNDELTAIQHNLHQLEQRLKQQHEQQGGLLLP